MLSGQLRLRLHIHRLLNQRQSLKSLKQLKMDLKQRGVLFLGLMVAFVILAVVLDDGGGGGASASPAPGRRGGGGSRGRSSSSSRGSSGISDTVSLLSSLQQIIKGGGWWSSSICRLTCYRTYLKCPVSLSPSFPSGSSWFGGSKKKNSGNYVNP